MQLPLENRIAKDEIIRIPRSVTQEMINHRHYKAFIVFLQLKPLYVSGVILNDAGKLSYTQMADYCGLSLSGLRGKVRQLKKHKLLKVDRDKNFHLASYKTFVNLFKPQFLRRMRKYTYRNVAGADALIKTSAIRENFRKQEYVVKHKIINKEIYGTVNAHVDRIKQPEGLQNSSFQSTNDCRLGVGRTDLSQCAIRKLRKALMQDYDNRLHKQKQMFLKQMEQIEQGLPFINPYITLSCAGLGRLFGVTGSAGHYQQQKLLKAGVINVKAHYEKIAAHVPAVYEGIHQMRKDVFSYNYPVKRGITGREQKYFFRLPNLMNVNLNFIYENAKN